MVKPLTFILIVFIAFSFYTNNVNDQKGEKSQNTTYIISGIDSLIIDSLMQYCYHSSYHFKRNLAMEGVVFFLKYNSKIYLFSTLHNFTGIDPDTKKLIDGLSNSPTDLWTWKYGDTISPWNKNYKLYDNKRPLFIEAGKDKEDNDYDIAAYNITDSLPIPKHVLDYDKMCGSETINVGDTSFYWGFTLAGYEQSKIPKKFIGKIKEPSSPKNSYIVSDILSGPGSSGAAVFKISMHKFFLIGLIARGNSEKNIVYITPFKESAILLNL
jgi:hypothetical protein